MGGCLVRASRSSWRIEGLVASGGLVAQAALLAVASAWMLLLRPPVTSAIHEILWVWVVPNLVIAGFNLLPLPTSDGPELWLFGRQLLAARKQANARDARHDSMRDLEESDARFEAAQQEADRIAGDILASVRKKPDE